MIRILQRTVSSWYHFDSGRWRRMHPGALLLFAVLAPLPAAASAQIDDRENAAYWYNRAVEAMEEALEIQRDFKIPEDWDAYYAYVEGRSDEVPPIVRRYLQKLPKAFDMMHRGAQRARVNHNVQYHEGPEALLPHLAPYRGIVRELNYDAHRRIREHDPRTAAKNLATIIMLQRHLASDRLSISSLVGSANFSLADATIEEGFGKGEFDAADAATLLRAMRRASRQDPFGYREAVAMEQEMMVGWLRELAVEGLESERLREVLSWSMLEDERNDFLEQMRAMGFDAAIDQFDHAMARVVQAFTAEDHDEARKMIEQLTADIREIEMPLVKTLMMNYDRMFEQMIRSEEMFAKRKAMLEEIIGGQLDVHDLVNAAKLYFEAMEQYRLIPEEHRAVIEQSQADADVQDAAALDAAFAAAELVMEKLREAAALERCDFVVYQRWTHPRDLVPEYVLGLNDLWRLLHVQAISAIRTQKNARAANCMNLSLRMAIHMEHEGPMLRAMLAHHWFNQTLVVAKQAMELERITEQQQHMLAMTLQEISRRDPFGYQANLSYTRSVSRGIIWNVASNDPDWEQRREEYEALYNHDWSAAHVLYFAAIAHVRRAREAAHDPAADAAEPAETTQPFDGLRTLAMASGCEALLDEAALGKLIQEVDAIGPALSLGQVDVITGQESPLQIVPWDRWRLLARAQLRQASTILPVPRAESEPR